MPNISDVQIQHLVTLEKKRQQETLCMLASENVQSEECLRMQASVFANKTLEGTPGKRYHSGGCYADELEIIANRRACELFRFPHSTVQPHSGSQANHIVYRALLKPGDKVMAMDLNAGGHLSHGASVNMTSELYAFRHYGVDSTDDQIDYDALERAANDYRPSLIICGGSSYPRAIEFERLSQIARNVGALLMIDMSHFSGQVAANLYPSSIRVADVVTSTFYKSMRGPRGAFILSNSSEIGTKIDKAVFPGYQGTPAFNVIAAKAVCLHEVRRPSFYNYVRKSLELAQQLAEHLKDAGFDLVANGTDTSMLLVDLRKENFSGRAANELLEAVGIIANHNLAPFDHRSPREGSALRLSTNVMAARHIGAMSDEIFSIIIEVLASLHKGKSPNVEATRRRLVTTLENAAVKPELIA